MELLEVKKGKIYAYHGFFIPYTDSEKAVWCKNHNFWFFGTLRDGKKQPLSSFALWQYP